MDFDLNEDQKEIKTVARELLAARSSWARVRTAAESRQYDASLWHELVDLGWPGIAVSERWGGQGLGVVELAALLEELGYACAAVPFLSTAVAATALDRFGTDTDRERWLPGLVAGELTAGLGRPDLLVDGEGATFALVLEGDTHAGTGGLLAIEDVTGVDPVDAIDPTRRVGALENWSGEPLADGAAQLVFTAVAAELVGVCQRALDMTVAYVSERKQFGVAVGAFQAVSHRAAEMLLHTESLRSAAYYAAWAADAEPDRFGEGAALAAAAGATGGRETTAAAIQLHGGIGFTWEADVHWLYKRAEVDRALLGGASRHHGVLARAAADRLVARV